MVGVQNLVECPQCHFPEAFYEYQTRGCTESLHCNRCGYRRWSIALTDKKQEQIDEQGYKVRYFKTTKQGNLIHRVYERKGYGAYSIDQGTGVVRLCRFTDDGEPRDKLVAKLKALRRQGLKITITVVDDDKIREV